MLLLLGAIPVQVSFDVGHLILQNAVELSLCIVNNAVKSLLSGLDFLLVFHRLSVLAALDLVLESLHFVVQAGNTIANVARLALVVIVFIRGDA